MRRTCIALVVAIQALNAQDAPASRSASSARLARLVDELADPRLGVPAADELVRGGAAAVPYLVEALRVRPGATFAALEQKQRILVVLARMGPQAKDAATDVFVAAFRLPITLTASAFEALAAVGPSAHVRFQLHGMFEDPAGFQLNGMHIFGASEGRTMVAVMRAIEACQQALRESDAEVRAAQEWLQGKPQSQRKDERAPARFVAVLRDMVRQALAARLELDGMCDDDVSLHAARFLVLHASQDSATRQAQAYLLLRGTADERRAAAVALAHAIPTDRHTIMALVRALHDADPRVVRECVTGLRAATPWAGEVVPELEALLHHADKETRARAQAMLAQLRRG